MAVEILSLLSPVVPGSEQLLRATLARFDASSPFGHVPGTHVARLTVMNWLGTGDPTHRRRLRPARLLFSAVVDGPIEAWLWGLLHKQGAAVGEIYQHCTGWPARERTAWTPWLLEQRLEPTHVIVAHDATVAEIERGLRLKRTMARLKYSAQGLPPAELRAAYRNAMTGAAQ